MRNVNGYPSQCIERKYDLKGSTYTRITIPENQDIPLNELKFHDTLKDLDFNKYEKKLFIPQEMSQKVQKIRLLFGYFSIRFKYLC